MKIEYVFTIQMAIALKPKHQTIRGIDTRAPAVTFTQRMHGITWPSHSVPQIAATIKLGYDPQFSGMRVKAKVTDAEWEVHAGVLKATRIKLFNQWWENTYAMWDGREVLATIFPEITYLEAMRNAEKRLTESILPLFKTKGIEVSTTGPYRPTEWIRQKAFAEQLLDS